MRNAILRNHLNTGEVIIYSGEENIHQGGVAIMMSQQTARCLMEWTPENSRIIRARFHSKYRKLTLIHAYSPTNDASIESKDDFLRTNRGYGAEVQQK